MSKGTEHRDTFRAMSLFSEFTDAELEAFSTLVDPITVAAGECIVRQDEKGDCMYIIVDGRAKVIHQQDGKRFELALLQSGDFFGELALVDEGPRSANVEAVTDCVLLRIPQSVVRALAGVYPSAAFKLLVAVGRVLVGRLRKGNQKYIDSLLLSSGGKD